MNDERNQLAGDIAGYLANQNAVPEAPKEPGPNASPAERVAFEAAQRDYGVLKTLTKSTGDVSVEERAELLRQIRDCAGRNWE
jgi:hypothetical protein